ncbi:MAG TPA: S24 family peptidase [Allosphingosinicella sp.]|nr:S24 family peptidase [Allosphingosinicella sp.]
MTDPRAELQRLIDERGEDYSSLSRLIGRNAAYVQQYIKRGVPRRLAEQDRRLLARYFQVGEERLGGPPAEEGMATRGLVAVPRLQVGASAGSGAVDGDERAGSHFAFDAKWLRTMGAGDPQRLSIIRVEGDSMVPTLADGDEILVDAGEARDRLRDGIYVLRMDDALVVKRLAFNPATRRVSIKSDNGAYPSWPDCPLSAIDVVGRVVWAGRRIS